MALFLWNDRYSVGVKEMDTQHKVLVDILNELFEAMQAKKSNDVLGQIISKLINYTKTHFAAEERYMEKFGYPELAAQKREHMAFVNKITEFKRDFEAGKIALSINMTSFLKDWLVNHISGIDKKYGPFFNEKGLH